MAWYVKYYRCSQGHEWQDEWEHVCSDRCPECNEETEPHDYEEIDLEGEDQAYQDVILHGRGMVNTSQFGIESVPFIMLFPRGRISESN